MQSTWSARAAACSSEPRWRAVSTASTRPPLSSHLARLGVAPAAGGGGQPLVSGHGQGGLLRRATALAVTQVSAHAWPLPGGLPAAREDRRRACPFLQAQRALRCNPVDPPCAASSQGSCSFDEAQPMSAAQLSSLACAAHEPCQGPCMLQGAIVGRGGRRRSETGSSTNKQLALPATLAAGTAGRTAQAASGRCAPATPALAAHPQGCRPRNRSSSILRSKLGCTRGGSAARVARWHGSACAGTVALKGARKGSGSRAEHKSRSESETVIVDSARRLRPGPATSARRWTRRRPASRAPPLPLPPRAAPARLPLPQLHQCGTPAAACASGSGCRSHTGGRGA